jgi:hypothetical protein
MLKFVKKSLVLVGLGSIYCTVTANLLLRYFILLFLGMHETVQQNFFSSSSYVTYIFLQYSVTLFKIYIDVHVLIFVRFKNRIIRITFQCCVAGIISGAARSRIILLEPKPRSILNIT